jgi:hypothetical protein
LLAQFVGRLDRLDQRVERRHVFEVEQYAAEA